MTDSMWAIVFMQLACWLITIRSIVLAQRSGTGWDFALFMLQMILSAIPSTALFMIHLGKQ